MPDQAKTRVGVDLSLFTSDNSFGHINGDMLFAFVPDIGDVVSFTCSESGGVDGLIGTVRVEATTHATDKTLLILSDVCVGSKAEAFQVSRFLEKRFGLFANIHDDDDLRAYMDQERDEDR